MTEIFVKLFLHASFMYHFKSSRKELVSRQLLKFFERNSAKNDPNSLITLVGMSSDFEASFEFNFLTIEVTLSVLTFWKVKVLLYFFICSLIATMLGWPSNFVMILSILSLLTLSLFSWKEVIPRLETIFIKYSLKVWASSIIGDHFISFFQGYSFISLIFITKNRLYIFPKLLIVIDVRHFKVSIILLFSFS